MSDRQGRAGNRPGPITAEEARTALALLERYLGITPVGITLMTCQPNRSSNLRPYEPSAHPTVRT